MSVKTELNGDVAILHVKGKLMGGSETEECHSCVKDYIADGNKKIVADLSHVKWVNSKGLGMLMACFTSLKNAGGDFKIAGATEKTRSLLMITKLLTIFECYDKLYEAVDSFK